MEPKLAPWRWRKGSQFLLNSRKGRDGTIEAAIQRSR
jgi:hypothetical protein